MNILFQCIHVAIDALHLCAWNIPVFTMSMAMSKEGEVVVY